MHSPFSKIGLFSNNLVNKMDWSTL